MNVTRRQFMQGGVAAFTVSFAAPSFLSELAMAQGAGSRALVILYLSGGNDALSTLVPYTDSFYYSRRPTIAIPTANLLQIGTDSAGRALGLHPRLTGFRRIFDEGRLAIVQRTGYPNSSRSHFQGTDIWSTADPANPSGSGWLGRYLDALPSPVDPLVGWSATQETPRTLVGSKVSAAAIPTVATYNFGTPNPNVAQETQFARAAATAISSHLPSQLPHLSFVNGSIQAALATIDRVQSVNQYASTITYPNNGLAQAFRAVAGALNKGVGTRVFWVQTGGYDTHASQNPNNGTYFNLMATLDDAVNAFYTDLKNQGLLSQTLVLQFSEFGRRIGENGSQGTDHGSGGLMFAFGGDVRGGIYGTAASLNPTSDNPTLVNGQGDVAHETDFRSVYARVIEQWLGADSVGLLGGNFRNAALTFI